MCTSFSWWQSTLSGSTACAVHEVQYTGARRAIRRPGFAGKVAKRGVAIGLIPRRRLSVADTGAGIADEHLANIFERFYRADASRQQATGGSGLGLVIVKSIVTAHGGSIAVVSQIGQGTTFTISLPAASPNSNLM